MNSSFLIQSDFLSETQVKLPVQRLGNPKSTKFIRVGDELKFLDRDKGRLFAKVSDRDADFVQADICSVLPAPQRLPLRILVGLSRPQTVKKVLQLATQLGVAEVIFFHAENSQRSYASAEIWKEENLQRELQLAMEQAWDPNAPIVQGPRALETDCFLPVVEEAEPEKIVLQGDRKGKTVQLSLSGKSAILALGPEAGLSDEEVVFFLESGFQQLSLGPRILRVETALGLGLGYLLGQVGGA